MSLSHGGWSTTLARHLSLPPLHFPNSHPTRPHSRPTGSIWRSLLAQSIFSDLSDLSDLSTCPAGTTNTSTITSSTPTGKRIVHLDYPGLSGVLMYEYPPAADREARVFTLEGVFGDEGDEGEDEGVGGMDIEELADRVCARLVYVPAYACTSFVTGQVMNAYLYHPDLRPYSTRHGFMIVDSLPSNVDVGRHRERSDDFVTRTLNRTIPQATTPEGTTPLPVQLIDTNTRNRSFSEPLPLRILKTQTDIKDQDSPSATATERERVESGFELEEDTSISTTDSIIGPTTPPPRLTGTLSQSCLSSPPSISISIEPYIDITPEDSLTGNNIITNNYFDHSSSSLPLPIASDVNIKHANY